MAYDYGDQLDLFAYAKDFFKSEYGLTVDFNVKRKLLIKFGRSDDVSNTTPTTLMGNLTDTLNETYVSANSITHFASTAMGDTSISLAVEGHTISGGLLTFYSSVSAGDTITTNASDGNTKTALPTPLARITRAYALGSTNLTGTVYFSEDVNYTTGTPASGVHLTIPTGFNQSQKASTSVSNSDVYIIRRLYGDVLTKGAVAYADIRMETRQVGSVFRVGFTGSAVNTGSRMDQHFEPFFPVPNNSDIRLRALGSADNLSVSGGMMGYLGRVLT